MKIFALVVLLLLKSTVFLKCTYLLLPAFFLNSDLLFLPQALKTSRQLNIFVNLSPHYPMDHCNENSFTIVEEIKSESLNNRLSVSTDVISLFTNIPLKETIELGITVLSKQESNFKMSKNIYESCSKLLLVREILCLKASFMI